MKKFKLIIIISLIVLNCQAQRFGGALLLGFNASQIDGDNAAGFRKFGVSGGLRGITYLSEKSQLLIDLLYSPRGSKSTINDIAGVGQLIELSYIEIPIQYQYNDWLIENKDGTEYYKVQVHGGLSISRLINSNVVNGAYTRYQDFFTKTDLSWTAAISYFLNPKLGLELKYSSSITPLLNNKNIGFAENSLRPYFFNVSTFYKF
jgi:Outer membrane protein beta-barrel domain